MEDSGFVYRMTRLDNKNKQGVLTADENGYYTICVGALDHSSRNVDAQGRSTYYTAEGASKFFAEGTLFNQRIQGGFIKAEYGHPPREPGMTDMQYVERNMGIRESEVCAQFGAIWLVPNYVDPLTGEKCVGIFAKVKPMGPKGHLLEKELQDKGLNVCFSIRALTTNKIIGGRKCKVLHTVITFDYVNEPGITCAEKMISPSLESYTPQVSRENAPLDVDVTPVMAQKILAKQNQGAVSMESSTLSILKTIAKEETKKETRLRSLFQ